MCFIRKNSHLKNFFTLNQVQVDDLKCTGTGTNKKDAKRQASENMLQLLGLKATPKEKPSPKPAESVSVLISRKICDRSFLIIWEQILIVLFVYCRQPAMMINLRRRILPLSIW